MKSWLAQGNLVGQARFYPPPPPTHTHTHTRTHPTFLYCKRVLSMKNFADRGEGYTVNRFDCLLPASYIGHRHLIMENLTGVYSYLERVKYF